ncbi:MAG: PEP-CTERM sorting domain-containing protein [Terracidiphilus sp.]
MVSKSRVKATLFAAIVATLAWAAVPAFAQTCVGPTGGEADNEGVSSAYLTAGAGCNDLITIASNGSISTTYPNTTGFYDVGGDDNLIGVQNNSSKTISSLNLSSTTNDIYGFDGDGVCSTWDAAGDSTGGGYTFAPNGSPCGSVNGANLATQYGTELNGILVTFSPTTDYAGTVLFGGGGIPSGGFAEFSLEGPVDLSLTVTSGTPEPSTFYLLGTGLLGLIEFGRRRRRV